eukprot:GHVP01063892.1.p1 GENE.GHVP01063892.1~~GHVP01063892.1.p1  ORF type:complete len:100 (+),score=8.53 GHVP01063892.1:237-536(+)
MEGLNLIHHPPSQLIGTEKLLPTPTPHHLVRIVFDLQNFQYVSKIDIVKAFHFCEILSGNESSIASTNKKCYHYNVLSMGDIDGSQDFNSFLGVILSYY